MRLFRVIYKPYPEIAIDWFQNRSFFKLLDFELLTIQHYTTQISHKHNIIYFHNNILYIYYTHAYYYIIMYCELIIRFTFYTHTSLMIMT